MCVNRAIGQNRGGHGSDQRGHARGREEPLGHGEMLRDLCAAVQQVRTTLTRLASALARRFQRTTNHTDYFPLQFIRHNLLYI